MQIADQMAFLFTADDRLEIDAESWEKVTKVERAAEILDAVIAYVRTCEWPHDADPTGIDPRPAIEALGLKPNKLVMPILYTAVEGRGQGLPLFDSIRMLGRESSLARLEAARARL